MENKSEGLGGIGVILDALESQQLPRAIDLMDKVEQDGRLDSIDIGFLERLLTDIEELKPWLTRYPEYQDLVARAIDLYDAITTRALENEKRGRRSLWRALQDTG